MSKVSARISSIAAMASVESAIQEETRLQIYGGDGKTIASVVIEKMHDVWWVTSLWVAQESRQQSLGSKLLERAVANYGDRELWVFVYPYADRPLTTDQLTAWYRRYGFEVVPGAPGLMKRPADGASITVSQEQPAGQAAAIADLGALKGLGRLT